MARPKKRYTGTDGPIKPGDPAPNFTLSDQKGERHSLSEYRSEWALLYFLSKEDMERCTEENCPIRDDFLKFRQRRVHVMGITPYAGPENYEFAKKFGIGFRLLSDSEKKTAKSFGVTEKRERNGKIVDAISRVSILVSPRGKVEKIYRTSDEKVHADQIMADLMEIPETQNRRVAPEDMRIPGIQDRRFSMD